MLGEPTSTWRDSELSVWASTEGHEKKVDNHSRNSVPFAKRVGRLMGNEVQALAGGFRVSISVRRMP